MDEKLIEGLLIEDDQDDVMILMDLMSKDASPNFRFAFTCVEKLETGLRHLSTGGIEVVLLDLMLPDSLGIDTLLKVRAHAPNIPIVVLTGLRNEDLGLEALRRGAQDYVVKGDIQGRALRRTISYAVERHRLVTSLTNIIDGAPYGMVIVDSAGLISYVNRAAKERLGWSTQSFVGKPFPHRIPKDGCGEIKIGGEEGGKSSARIHTTDIQWNDKPAKLVTISEVAQARPSA